MENRNYAGTIALCHYPALMIKDKVAARDTAINRDRRYKPLLGLTAQ